MHTNKVGLIIGSLRTQSYSRKIANLLITLSPEALNLEIIEIGGLTMYDQDMEATAPDPWQSFRIKIKSCSGFIFVTPEYNRSIPAVLKNAIDIGSRPVAENAWNGKPAAIISVSPGAMGGFGANHHLRQCLVFLNMAAMAQPEVYLAHINALFNDQGQMKNEDTTKFIQSFLDSYKTWLSRFADL